MDSLSKYINATFAELKQVSWPTTQQAINYTALVIGITILVALYAGAFDYVFAQFIQVITGSL